MSNSKVSDGGPAASDCNRDAIPPFAAPTLLGAKTNDTQK